MLKIIILALLFLTPEKTSSFNISLMLISDALPVQFWLAGCATFNQHEAAGVFHKCFCAPWECDDEIKVQFTDDPAQNFSLEIYDDEGDLLGSVDFEEPYVGVYESTLNIAQDSPDICDQQIQLKIKRNQGLQGVSLPALNTWQNDGGAGDPWSLGSSPNVTLSLFGTSTENLYVDYAFIVGVTYTIIIDLSASGNSTGIFTVAVTDGSFVTQFSETTSGFSSGSHSTDPLIFTATADTTRIAVAFSLAGTGNIAIDAANGQRSVGDSEIVAYTDCLDIRQNHEETILLTYSNHRNFAGLKYDGTSPQTEFNIRIPAIFFHQRFPEEDETMELSSELVTLSGTLRKQRQLDVDYVPYYFHEKLKLILKHQILTVFNKQWIKQEAYEIVEGNRLSPLKKAKCWLSDKEFVHRNIL
jgi:hypothetical protein